MIDQEQAILDAFNHGKGVGYAEGMRAAKSEIEALKGWKSFPEDASYFEVYNPWNMNQVLRFSKEFIEGYGK